MPSYLVTGANRGLGYGFVQYLSKDPANTIIGLVRDKAAADQKVAADGLKNVIMLQGDISNRKALLAARDETAKVTGGSLDYLINNAAYIDRDTEVGALDDYEEKEPERLEHGLKTSFEVNVVGVINTINIFLPLIKKGDAKKVVVISSGMADPDLVNGGGIWNGASYSISKAAVNMAVFKYNAKYKDQGILFFALSPGVVSTWQGQEPAAIADLRKLAPGWSGPLTPLESAEACTKVIHDFSLEKGNGGAFVSHHGNKEWL